MHNLTKKQSEIEYALNIVESMDVTIDENIEILQEISSEASRVKKELENERVGATKPLNESLRQINGWFKPVVEACDMLKRKANARLVEAQKAREEARELALGEIAKQGPHVIETVVMPAQAKPVELPKGVGRVLFDIEIENAAMVPREYLVPDVRAIKQAVTKAYKEGTTLKIEGVRVITKESGT